MDSLILIFNILVEIISTDAICNTLTTIVKSLLGLTFHVHVIDHTFLCTL